MKKSWFVIAHRAGCRIFSKAGAAGPLELVETLDNAEGRLQNREIDSDKGGTTFANPAHGRHVFSTEVSAHEQVAKKFATLLGNKLEEAAVSQRFDELILVAEPHFLGLLRQELGKNASARVTRSLEKDLANVKDNEMQERLS